MNGLFKKFIEYAMGNGIVVILGVISTPIVYRLIGPVERGKADLFVTYTSLLVLLLTMGIDQAFIRYYNDEDKNSRGQLLRKSVKMPILLSLILGILCIIFNNVLSRLIVNEADLALKESLILSSLFALNIIISIISNFAIINIRMKQKAKNYSLVGVSNKISYLIFLFIFFSRFNENYITLVFTTVFANLIMLIVGILFEKNDWFNISKKGNLKTTTKDLTKYGAPFIFSMGLTWIFQSVDRLSIQRFSTSEQVGLYSGAMSIVAILNTIQGIFTTFWTPVAYERYSNNPCDTKFFSKINEIVSFVMLLIATLLIGGKDLLSIMFLGDKYKGSEFIFPFLVLMPIMYTISETTVLGVNFKKKTKAHIFIALASAISNIVGNFILVPKYGAKGAAISTGLAYVIFFITRSYFGNKYYKININYKKLFISVLSVYILAIYSSVYKFNLVIFILTTLVVLIILYLYKNLISETYELIKIKLKKK
ncbi:oligosaccharide flippase family protein [Clostridium sp.]|uniref:oligosaccharide flippase family protein n=1 Tax=Clostridium sp. TaxID=1506 RepID=UPI00260A9AD3|nr:oligosaccharide flippase family protein [Clostridium sp.]